MKNLVVALAQAQDAKPAAAPAAPAPAAAPKRKKTDQEATATGQIEEERVKQLVKDALSQARKELYTTREPETRLKNAYRHPRQPSRHQRQGTADLVIALPRRCATRDGRRAHQAAARRGVA